MPTGAEREAIARRKQRAKAGVPNEDRMGREAKNGKGRERRKKERNEKTKKRRRTANQMGIGKP